MSRWFFDTEYLRNGTRCMQTLFQWYRYTNRDLHMSYSTVSFRITLSDLAKYSKTRSIAQSLCDYWASCIPHLPANALDIFRRRLKTELYECSYNWHCACQTTLLVCVTHFHFPCSFLLWPQPWSLSTIHSMTFILDNNPTWHTIGHFEDKSREEAKQQLVQFMLCRWSAPQRLTFWHW